MKRLGLLLLVILITFMIFGCESSDEKAVKAVIQANFDAMMAEDTSAYMETISMNSPLYDATAEQMDMIFAYYDLSVVIEAMEIVEISDTEASIRVTQKTTNNNAAEFMDNITTAVHTLEKIQGEWKIKATVVEETKPF